MIHGQLGSYNQDMGSLIDDGVLGIPKFLSFDTLFFLMTCLQSRVPMARPLR